MAPFSFDFIKKRYAFLWKCYYIFRKNIKNNFLPKNPEILMAKNIALEYKSIGLFNIKILDS